MRWLADTPLDGFFPPGDRPALLLNPILLDAIGHVTAFWICQYIGPNFSCFPSRIEAIDLYDAAREDTRGVASLPAVSRSSSRAVSPGI